VGPKSRALFDVFNNILAFQLKYLILEFIKIIHSFLVILEQDIQNLFN
jgi:hypothetical protein